MNVTLYDSKTSLPDDLQQHILVFTGFTPNSSAGTSSIVTEVHCIYRVGGHIVEYKKNSDADTARFEEALGWAVRQADVIGVSNIHAVFELSRPIEPRFLARVCPNGLRDRRRRANLSPEDGYLSVPAWPNSESRKQSFSMSPLRRYYIFRNKQPKAEGNRRIATSP